MASTSTFKPQNKPVWDTTFSTYYWEITLRPGERVKMIKGYSKAQGHQEKADKVSLLIRIVIMLRNKNWLQKADKITFWRRDGNFIGQSDTKILVLWPDTHQLNCATLIGNKMFYDFLKNFYINVTTGEEIQYLKPKEMVKGISPDQEYTNAIIKSYSNLDELQVKYLYLQSIGIAKGMLMDFYTKVLQKQPNLK